MASLKRVLYLTPVLLDTMPNAGIRKKVFGQLQALRALGYEAQLLYLHGDGLLLTNGDGEEKQFTLPKQRPLFRQWGYYDHVAKLIGNLARFSHVYLRYHVPTPAYLRFLKMVAAIEHNPFVYCEVPTYPYTREFNGLKGRAYHFLDSYYANKAGQYYDEVISFYPAKSIFGHTPILLENALARSIIDEGAAAGPREMGKQTGPLRMIGLAANLERFHGYDRVIRGMKEYLDHKTEDQRDVHLTIISQGDVFEELKVLANEFGLTEKTTFLSPRVGKDLYDIIQTMDLGIGTIARYRVELFTDSSLKTREYCAFGVPQLLSAEDRSFPKELTFVRYIPNDDSPVPVGDLVSWLEDLHQQPNWQVALYRHADEQLSWKGQMSKAFAVSHTVPT
ncbi:hypothetical protein [Lewinella sp. 4G2]|uniref:hypothetical protein n=1 Tax=Lewinella sp. 4G2 TaxID=1803372 RepID=UPI0007B47141|nr:hypothetical protein [Lewinella sp. 4G2]OAV44309.1 hypothetical protein A3850_007295 [Lewinella sp. 4G2]